MFAPTRDEARRFLTDAWRKYRAGEPLSGLEQTAAQLIAMHPEYHAVLESPERYLDRDYSAITNSKRRTAQENEYSVRLELQADFLAGVWAHHADKNIADFNLTDDDIKKAITAAHRIGDDTLQERAGRRADPKGFTHGTSAQRMAWFKYGLETGDVSKAEMLFRLPYNRLMPPR